MKTNNIISIDINTMPMITSHSLNQSINPPPPPSSLGMTKLICTSSLHTVWYYALQLATKVSLTPITQDWGGGAIAGSN